MAQRLPRTQAEPLSGLGAAVFDALPIGLYVVDRGLRVVAWNSLREKGPLGLPRGRALGRPLRRVLPPRGYKATVPILSHVFKTGIPHEETTETRAGLFHVRRLPVREGPRVTHVLSCFEDITERRTLEMRLIASDRLAFLGQLVAGVAHEVSNPLAGIAGCAEALASLATKGSGKAAREARKFRDLIRHEVSRCEVVARIPRELPPARLETDSLKQVVMALAMNGSQAMPGGGTLTLRAGRAGRDLFLDVIDTGPGVPPAIRARIFEPYFTTSVGAGAGLGLAIARTLVRRWGGDVVHTPRRTGAGFRVVMKAAERA